MIPRAVLNSRPPPLAILGETRACKPANGWIIFLGHGSPPLIVQLWSNPVIGFCSRWRSILLTQ